MLAGQGYMMQKSVSHRLLSIDAMRGFVIVLMLFDHVRETFFLHQQVSDPVDVTVTAFPLFFSRSLDHICATVFIFLTGVSAALYGIKVQSMREISGYLFRRGLLLVLLEVTVINFAWTFRFPPDVIYLQVIWAIGLSMIALSALVWLDRRLITAIGVAIIAGHNLLDPVSFSPDSVFYIPWAILHDRSWIEVGHYLRVRTSYPVLPWIGVIAIGYVFGPLFFSSFATARRQQILIGTGISALALFFILRLVNGYGEKPWHVGETVTQTMMSFFNITKYPPSLLFILLTLGVGLLVLTFFERHHRSKPVFWLTVFGSVPMFFYILHLYVLKFLYLVCISIWGLNQGQYFGFESVASLWVMAAALTVVLYFPVRTFSHFKFRRRDIGWLKYF